MNIVSTQYTLRNMAFEIYVSGCYGNCKGCHNIELKDFNIGEKINDETLNNILKKINRNSDMINNIWILGGEPLDNDLDELIELINKLKIANKKIWIFTRYELSHISHKIIEICDYIKTGAYLEELKTEKNIQYGIKLATSNQYIYRLKGE